MGGNTPVNGNNGVNNSNFPQIKFGAKRTEMKTAEQRSIFDKLDTNKDGVINDKDTSVVNGWAKNKDGKLVENKYIKLQDLPEGRSLVAGADGRQWVRAKDGVILKESYVKFDSNTGNVSVNQKQKQLINAQNMTSKFANETREAKILFDRQMKEDGIFEDIADGVSAAWGSDNRASEVRKDFEKLDNGVKKMNRCIKNQDMNGFQDAFKETYGVEYNEKNINEYYKHPTPENRKKAFGDSRVSDIKTRVKDYNESQKTGGAVVKGVAVATGAAVTGGASVGAFAVASGAFAVGADVVSDLTKGEGHKDFSLSENASHLTDKENLVKYGKDGVLSAGAAYLGGQVGKAAGKYVANKVMSSKFQKILAEHATDYGEKVFIDSKGFAMLNAANNVASTSGKVVGYVADSTTSSVAEAAGEAATGASFGTSLGSSASGVLGDGIAEGGKKIVKNVIKKPI